jgi:acyl transferase domain-containing protein
VSAFDSADLSSVKLALAIQRLRSANPDSRMLLREPIAVIGMGCRFPGGVRSPEDYWRLLRGGVNAISEIPPDRWPRERFHDPDPQRPGRMNTRWGGFIDGPDLFDPVLFGIAPREAASMDPQQRLALEVTWEALWNGGLAPDQLAGSRAGVFVAIYNSDYARLLLENPDAIGPHTCAGAANSIASGRISYLLDLHGPSVSVDTACSSSLVAIHMACQSLRMAECRMALAGGVALSLTPEHLLSVAKVGMLSPDGRCKTFDARANGFVPGEGCGMVVLKRLSDALTDGDRVRAVIRGSALNQDGRTSVLTAPNGLAQRQVIRAALENAGVSPAAIGYVETHGTGTALGDPIEVEALAEVLNPPGSEAEPCALGAVKTNFGHLEAAAGVAGLIKTVLALEHGEIPPNLHFETLNPNIALEGTRFSIPVEPRPWPRGARGRFAGVSSFGFSGTNAHIVLEEAPRLPGPVESAEAGEPAPMLLAVSARSAGALRDFAARYRDFLDEGAEGRRVPLYDLCHSSALRRSHYEERLAITGASGEELHASLQLFVDGRTSAALSSGRAAYAGGGGLVFVFSGQGSQWAGMGTELCAGEPVFRAAIEECDRLIRRRAGWSLIEQLAAGEAESQLHRTAIAQPAIFAVEIALARLWRSWGIVPAAVAGHSLGEIAAAQVAGVLDLDEGVRLTVERGRLMESASGLGAMAAVHLPAGAVAADIAAFGEKVSIAAANSPVSTVVSGDRACIDRLVGMWRGRGVGCRMLPVNYAFHSSQMEPFRSQLMETLGRVETRKAAVPVISTITGMPANAEEFDAAYWAGSIRRPVLFAAAIRQALAMGLRSFLEIGPHPVLAPAVSECLAEAGEQGSVIASLRRGGNERSALLRGLGKLYVEGQPVDWKAVYPQPAAAVNLPVYPYQRQRYWIEKTARAAHRDETPGGTHPLAGRRLLSPAFHGSVFESRIDLASLPYLADHVIGGAVIFPMAAWLEMVLGAARATHGPGAIAIEDLVVAEPLVLSGSASRTVQTILDGESFRTVSLEGETWTLHAQGRIRALDGAAAQPGAAGRPSATGAVLPPDDYYRQLRERGVAFGPAFRVLAELWTGAGEALARVALDGAREADQYHFHPALLDGCLQTAFAAAQDHAADDCYLPFSIDRFRVHGPGGSGVWARARLRPPSVDGDLSADIEVRDDSGTLLAEIDGLRLKRRRETGPERNLYAIQWRPSPLRVPKSAGGQGRRWLIAGDSPLTAAKLAEVLRERGEEPLLAPAGPVGDAAEELAGIVHLAGVDSVGQAAPPAPPHEAQRAGCGLLLTILQTVLRRAAANPLRIVVVTRDAAPAAESNGCNGIAYAPLWGLARTLAIEHPEIECLSVDLDPDAPDVEALADSTLHPDGEGESAFRAGERYVPRLEGVPADAAGPRRLAIPARGSIENLAVQPLERRAPLRGEVEVEVETSALNFRDVLNVLGMYPGDPGPLGLEFCGRVAQAGEGVTEFQAGDAVTGIAWGSFADFVVTPAALVSRVPEGLDAESAVTLPNAFLTAWHCLVHLAGIHAGDRVLIHAAAGGVGLAAVQLAQRAGAEIFATAGSEEKREYLRSLGIRCVMDSRTTGFASRILEVTGGQGVDIVLNSLAGEMIPAGFAALARGGRFIEIGKTGVWTRERVAALGKDIRYEVVDLGVVLDSAPELVRSHLAEIMAAVGDSSLRPLPKRVYGFDDAAAAFRHMAQARHIGKIVLRHGPAGIRVTGDASYMVTGGMGGLGLCVAEWLAGRGARYLALVGRGAPSGEAETAIERLRQAGVRVEVCAADVSRLAEMGAVLRRIGDALPPLRGIVHAAGVLDDGPLVQRTWESFERVMAPKVQGAWNLHELTRREPLDFFVLFSSAASVLGSPGQGNYAAANRFLDVLAHHRRARGLPALSVNWGPWAGVGMAARVEQQGLRRVLPGLRPMSADRCLAALGRAAERRLAQAVVADVDWGQWPQAPPLLSAVAPRPSEPPPAPRDDAIVEKLERAPVENKRAVLMAYLREQAARILGLSASHYIDERQPLLSLGLDSLMAVEFRNQLAAALKRPLSATLLFDHPTLASLADYFAPPKTASAAGNGHDAAVQRLAALSEEEAERLLDRELGASS